jgi:hypothetical protein
VAKLPPELTEGADALRLEHPYELRLALDQVEQWLVHRLLGQEGR